MQAIQPHSANLLKTLPKDQELNWPAYIVALVFAYNAMPHSTTGYQPYQLICGHKSQTPSDNWLGLSKNDFSESVSKESLIKKHYKLGWAANRWALKGIQQSMQNSADRSNSMLLEISEGSLVLLHDHSDDMRVRSMW